MKNALLTASFFLIAATQAPCELEWSASPSDAACQKYMQTPLPAEALTIAVPKTWPECNSPKLYWGIGIKPDHAAARECAWSERLAIQGGLEPRYSVASVLGGPAMLMVLYANGDGVERNTRVAGRLACEADVGNAIEDIEALPSKAGPGQRKLKYCDEVRTTMEIGLCAANDENIADQQRIEKLNRLSSKWPRADRAAFASLLKAEEAYSSARARGEINIAATMRATLEINAEASLRDNFLAAMESFEAGGLPKGTKEDVSRADEVLNSIYRKALLDAETRKSEYGAVQPEGIRDAERSWLRYRDAWVALAMLRHPSVSADSWLALLTRDRIAVLNDTECEIGIDSPSCTDQGDEQPPRPLP